MSNWQFVDEARGQRKMYFVLQLKNVFHKKDLMPVLHTVWAMSVPSELKNLSAPQILIVTLRLEL
jgi:hypothetical protein